MEPSREALVAEIRRLRAQARRDTDEINDAHEQVRVWRRVIERQVRKNDALTAECERLRHRLAVLQPEEGT